MRDQEIVVIVVLGSKFSLLLKILHNFSVISTLWWDPRASKKICALIGHRRMQNVFSFDSLVHSQKKKKNACSPSNTSYDVITKQFIFVIWIKSFPVFLVKRCKMCFLLIPSLIPQKRKEKKREKKAYMESKTVMSLNSVLMTTLILLYVKI